MEESQRQKYMQTALELASKGSGHVAPNPLVGAVIVKDHTIIGRGYHKKFGGPHAEVEALRDCRERGYDPADATMFVTLEPCCHFGKTPPCTQAILEAGIGEVDIATLDDYREVNGQGIEFLHRQGITVEIGCCSRQARRLNAGFFTAQKLGRPHVIVKWAQSIDAQLAWPENSDRRWISSDQSRRHVHLLRSGSGAVLTGVNTILADDPLLNVRLDEPAVQPLRVVLDRKMRIPVDCRLVRTAAEYRTLIYTIVGQEEKIPQLVQAGCEVVIIESIPESEMLREVLCDLGKRGITDVFVEAGPRLINAFLTANLADRLMVYIAPVIIGKGPAPLNLENIPIEPLDTENQQIDNDILLTIYLREI